MNKKSLIRKITAGVFCLALSLTAVCPLTAFAAETEQKTVRVGFYPCPFNIKGENGHLSGYAYDYQQDLAAYTGRKYEYVEASWPELLQMLKDGEIDLLSDVSYTPERETEMLEKGVLTQWSPWIPIPLRIRFPWFRSAGLISILRSTPPVRI